MTATVKNTMRAIIQNEYGSPDVLSLTEIDQPTVGDNDLLVQVHAAGVDRGVWHLMTGQPYLMRILGFGFRGPKARVRGSDVAGRVVAVGKNVTEFRIGDEVFGSCSGSFAEYASAPAEQFVHKPKNLSFIQAAAVPVSAVTALRTLRDAGELKAGQKVLIIGAAGGVGSFAVQLAKALGATVTGVCSTTKVELVRSLGADEVIDYTRSDFAADGPRYDLILDIAGNRPLSHLRRALSPQGILVIVGGEDGGRWFGGLGRQLGALLLSPFLKQKLRMMIVIPRRADLKDLSTFLESGQVTPVIDRTYPLPEAPAALRRLAEGKTRGKVVVTV